MLERRKATDVHTPGVRTSEFWVSVGAMLLPLLLPLLQQVGDKAPAGSWVALVVPAVVAFGYNISRGLAKQNVPPPLQQSMIENAAVKMATDKITGAVASAATTAVQNSVGGMSSGGRNLIDNLDDDAIGALLDRAAAMAKSRRRDDSARVVREAGEVEST